GLSGSHDLPAAFASLLDDGLDRGEGALTRSAAQARVIASPALADDERLPVAWREAALAEGFRALLSVPVESPRHGPGGLVAVFFDDERAFSEDDIELARHLAEAARGALERSELFEAQRTARALAQQLTRTGRLLT